jgi:hypothetical protein
MMADSDSVTRMLAGYEPIIRRFIQGELSASDFESEFLSYFKHDGNQVVSDEFEVLDGLFADVDEYVADPRLRAAGGGLDDNELRSRARRAYIRLYGEH